MIWESHCCADEDPVFSDMMPCILVCNTEVSLERTYSFFSLVKIFVELFLYVTTQNMVTWRFFENMVPVNQSISCYIQQAGYLLKETPVLIYDFH
jgi:hypothetical protein